MPSYCLSKGRAADVRVHRLADHSCGPSDKSPALLSSPQHSPVTPRAPSFPAEQEPETEVEPASLPTADSVTSSASSASLANETVSPSSPTGLTRSESQQNPKLDSFVPQTESLVPDDVLDLYEDDDFGDTEAAAAPSSASLDIPTGVPSDVSDHGLDSHLDQPAVSHPAAVAERRSSTDLPEDVDDDEDTLDKLPPAIARTPKAARGDGDGGRRSQSVYGSVGGSLYDDDDEENYEGGSVAIVSRTTASHSPGSSSMARMGTA